MEPRWISLVGALVMSYAAANSHWVQSNGPYPGDVTCLVVHGTSQFAGTNGSGVFRSNDSGRTWTPVNSGLTDNSIYTLAVIGTDLFAGTFGKAAFRSSDNGASWTPVVIGWMSGGLVYCFSVSGTDRALRDSKAPPSLSCFAPLCIRWKSCDPAEQCASSIFCPRQNAPVDHELSAMCRAMKG